MTTERFGDLAGSALVTGGTGGIGRAIVAQLAREGAAVTFTYRSNERLATELVTSLTNEGLRVGAIQLDLLERDHCASVVAVVAAQYGGLHSVIHAAGPHIPQQHLSTVEPAVFGTHVQAEVVACFNLLHPCLNHLRQSSGSIVAVTTAATTRYPVRDGLSSTPKAAVEQLIKGLTVEEGRYGVRANCVGPGMLTDGMAERLIASGDLDDRALDVTRQNIPLRRFGRATDGAEAVCFLASPRSNFISGQVLNVDGGFSV